MRDLTGIQRDILFVIAGQDEPYGLDIRTELEEYYKREVQYEQLYPNLDELVTRGLVKMKNAERRIHTYTLTAAGKHKIKQRVTWQEAQIDCSVE